MSYQTIIGLHSQVKIVDISPDYYSCNTSILSYPHIQHPQYSQYFTVRMPLTTVMDIVLNTPLKMLSAEPTQTHFLSQSQAERMETAYDLLTPYYREHLETAWPRTFRTKCGEKSSKYRNAGNTMYSRNKLRDAIRLYNEATFWAESGSEELSMAFANRWEASFGNTYYSFLYTQQIRPVSKLVKSLVCCKIFLPNISRGDNF